MQLNDENNFSSGSRAVQSAQHGHTRMATAARSDHSSFYNKVVANLQRSFLCLWPVQNMLRLW